MIAGAPWPAGIELEALLGELAKREDADHLVEVVRRLLADSLRDVRIPPVGSAHWPDYFTPMKFDGLMPDVSNAELRHRRAVEACDVAAVPAREVEAVLTRSAAAFHEALGWAHLAGQHSRVARGPSTGDRARPGARASWRSCVEHLADHLGRALGAMARALSSGDGAPTVPVVKERFKVILMTTFPVMNAEPVFPERGVVRSREPLTPTEWLYATTEERRARGIFEERY